MRLQKYIADCGVTSRRRAEIMISEGRVSVNGNIINEQGVKINPQADQVKVDGKIVSLKAESSRKTLLLHKPVGYVSTMEDPQNRPLVKDLYADLKERFYPVGRLDINTSGLLLCTNDGELAYQLMHPRFKFEKEYLITVAGYFGINDLTALKRGVELEDGPAQPLRAWIKQSHSRQSELSMVIGEGRNRQVRRMMAALGFSVISLQRTRLAFLTLAGVKKGSWRWLQKPELDNLRRLAEKGQDDKDGI
ncbi:MAG: rRNA pseudouridine synthase [Deltaproteobacteria bacterium]|nr:rRNA pseudouridine synthase [Deltaproteobacteria bacterium]